MENIERPIRILIVNGKMMCGGIESFIMNIYRNIDRNRIQFDFLVHYPTDEFYDDEIRKLGGNIYKLTFRKDNNYFKYIRDLKKFFKEHNYKIIWGHMEGLGSIYMRIAKQNGVKHIIAHSHITRPEKSIKGLIKRVLRYRIRYISNTRFACSTEAGIYLYGKKSFELFHNSINTKKFSFDNIVREKIREQYKLQNKKVIGMVGRFVPQKNYPFAIKIFNEILKIDNNYVLMICGDGDNKKDIVALAEKNKINEKIIFAGNVSNMSDYYQAFDFFLMPSLYEGLPVSGVEAQCSGLKCFFSNTITKEVSIVEENTIFLSLKLKPEEWARKIIEESHYERKNCGNIVRKAEYDIFDNVEKITKRLEEIYEN